MVLKYIPFFKIYKDYLNNYNNALSKKDTLYKDEEGKFKVIIKFKINII